MLKIWGRADGSNVIKAMWCIGALGIEHQRIDWGGEFGGNDDPAYRRKNPIAARAGRRSPTTGGCGC
jgi:glutathione S-transferase